MASPPAPDLLLREPRRPVVLVADDDAALRAVLGEALSDEGYASIAVASSREATAVLRTSAVALVITDSFSTPATVEVFDPTAALRAAAGDTPVALLTGYPIEEDAACAAGFVGLIAKPFDLTDFVACVRRWTRGRT